MGIAKSGNAVVISLGFFNSVFSAVTLLLITTLHGRGHFNLRKGFQMFILGITCSQLIYDMSSCLKNNCVTASCEGFQAFLSETAGFTTSALADAMAVISAYVVLRRQPIKTRVVAMATVFLASLGVFIGSFCAAFRSRADDEYASRYQQAYHGYVGLRIVEVVVALLACGFLLSELSCPGVFQDGGRKHRALRVLVVRVTAWPLSMAALRFVPLAWLFAYGDKADASPAAVDNFGLDEAGLYLAQAALTPMSGFVNLLILLAVQPLAWAHLMHFAVHAYNSCCSQCVGALELPELPCANPNPLHKSDLAHASRLRDLPDHDLLHVWLEPDSKVARTLNTLRVGDWGAAATEVENPLAAPSPPPSPMPSPSPLPPFIPAPTVKAAQEAETAATTLTVTASAPADGQEQGQGQGTRDPRIVRRSLLPGFAPAPPLLPPPAHLLEPADPVSEAYAEGEGDGEVGGDAHHGPEFDRVSYSDVYRVNEL